MGRLDKKSLVFKKIISCKFIDYLNNLSNLILVIKESNNKNKLVDKNIKINNNSKNYIISEFIHEKKLSPLIIKFLNTTNFNQNF